MKKIYSFLLLALVGLTARPAAAQTVFAPIGAEWWYAWSCLCIPPVSLFTHAQAVGDTTLGGQLARKILLETIYDTGTGHYGVPAGVCFVRTVGDDVFRWNPATGAYQLEYQFNRPVGAVWTRPGCSPGSSFSYVVDSVALLPVGNTALRIQYSFSASPGAGGIAALERIGQLGSLMEPPMFSQPWCGPGAAEGQLTLVSYTDADVQFGTSPVLHRAEPRLTAAARFAPNPSASGRFRREGSSLNPISYVVFDAQGRCVSAGQLTSAAPDLDLSTLPAGLYLLRGEVGGQLFTRRLVRE